MSDYLTMAELENKTLKEIYTYAREFKIPYYSQMNKKELSLAVIRAQAEKQGFFYMEGILDITHQDGYGFLRPINYGPSADRLACVTLPLKLVVNQHGKARLVFFVFKQKHYFADLQTRRFLQYCKL